MGQEYSPSPRPRATLAAPHPADVDDLWLKVWRLHPHGCPIVAADRTLHGTAPEGAARFCGPFTHANKAGWWLFPPVDLDITWRGGLEFDYEILTEYSDVDAYLVQFLLSEEERAAARPWLPAGRTKFTWGLVEPGVVQIWTGAIFQTPPGWGLHIRSPINWGSHDFHVMEAILETDWLHTDIWLNVMFHTEGQRVSLRRDAWPPIAQLVPVPRESYDANWRLEEETLHRRTPAADRVFAEFVDYNNKKFSNGGRQRWSKEDPTLMKDSTTYYRERRRARTSPPEDAPSSHRDAPPPAAPHPAAGPGDHGRTIRFAYQRYVTEVSRPMHAISLQLAFYLWELLAARSPARVVDLGSGFSSYVLRLYARECAPELEVWSVDDDPSWLARTRSFLETEGLDTQRTLLWQDLAEDSFDLVLHDLGSMTAREETLPRALSLVGADGALVLDDVHFPRYREHVERTLAACGARYESAEEDTRDLVGRFSWIAFPARSPS